MAAVLDFPSQERRAFAFLERELRAMLAARGADDALIQFAIESLTSVYTALSDASDCGFCVDLPSAISRSDAERLQQQITAGVEGMRARHHDLVLRLAAELVLARIRLFQHERTDDTS